MSLDGAGKPKALSDYFFDGGSAQRWRRRIVRAYWLSSLMTLLVLAIDHLGN
ncbi:hypothetical protein ACFVAV_25255 [Nocardia sp. NPDC057663]|uniref:hypothetical protein n=1 Tax=Nocardia sp. NPDC057663 TaxID=3346201 RepID=UPI003672F7EF